MKKIDIEKMIEEIDYIEIHKDQCFNDYGCRIWINEKGEHFVMQQNNFLQTSDFHAIFNCFGMGNINEHDYAEGWCEEEQDEFEDFTGNWIEKDSGRVLTSQEMLIECIETGEWTDAYEEMKADIRRQYEDHCREEY